MPPRDNPYGLRGVGKTVLLNKLRREAEAEGIACVWMEAPEDRSLPALLAPALRAALLKLERGERAKASAHKALKALASFVGALRFKYEDLELSIGSDALKDLADSGDLQSDLTDLLLEVGRAAQELDASFFRVRYDRLTPAEKAYVRAMATLGPGTHRSGDIAEHSARRSRPSPL